MCLPRLVHQLLDQSERIPDVNVAIHQSTGNEAESEVFRARTVLPPGETVETVGARALRDERQFLIVGLEIELEYLEIRGRAEGQINGASHGPGGQVRSVRRQRHRR